jgi:hypothetical protein
MAAEFTSGVLMTDSRVGLPERHIMAYAPSIAGMLSIRIIHCSKVEAILHCPNTDGLLWLISNAACIAGEQ